MSTSDISKPAQSRNEFPFTTAATAALSPKIPAYVGDSWRPTLAVVLGALPLAVASAALAEVTVASGSLGMSPRHAVVVPGQHGVTVAAGALASPKYPDDGGD